MPRAEDESSDRVPPRNEPGRSRPGWVAVGALLVLAVLAALMLRPSWLGPSLPAALREQLRDRGRVAVLGTSAWRDEVPGTRFVAADDVPELPDALQRTDPEGLIEVLRAHGVAALLVPPGPDASLEAGSTLAQRLSAYGPMPGLRARWVSPEVALYERRLEPALSSRLSSALAHVARQILAGEPLPRVRSFPEPLREPRNVEVMVLLERFGRPRLWRSARSDNIAQGLMTAASVARQRWQARSQALGGPLDELLPRLTVRVVLLEEDGTLASTLGPFLDRAITPTHGLGFERRGAWHYLLPNRLLTPERRELIGGSRTEAYRTLFDDAGLPGDSFDRAGLRFYRLLATELGVSSPTPSRPPAFDIGPGSLGMGGGLDDL